MLLKFDSKVKLENGSSRKTPKRDKLSSSSSGSLQFIPDGHDLVKAPKRSRKGCINCKIRKKKCNERKPVCSDCERLSKECIWIDSEKMSDGEIRELIEIVNQREGNQKIRKRKPKVKKAASDTRDVTQPSVSPPPTAPFATNPPFSIQEEGGGGGGRGSTNPQQNETDIHEMVSSPNIDSQFSYYPQNPQGTAQLPLAPSNSVLETLNGQFENEPVSTSSFLNFFKDLSQYQLQHLSPSDSAPGKLRLLDDVGQEIEQQGQQGQQGERHAGEDHGHGHEVYQSLDLSPNFNQFLNPLSPLYIPEIHINPSLLPDLSGVDYELYTYYVETLSKKISIAPISQNDSNSYQKVFLPLAHQDKGVLYGILAWACFHLGGEWEIQGAKYVDMALDHISVGIQKVNEGRVVDDRQSSILKLATLLILCGAEICRGDVKKWSVFLNWGWNILSKNGGILNFNQSREENWLISNFAYHDLLSSSNSSRGTYFPSNEYDKVFGDVSRFSGGSLNPLLGVCKKLYKIIGDVGSLVFDSKRIVEEYYNSGVEDSSSVGSAPKNNNNNYNSIISPEESDSPFYCLDSESQVSMHTKKSNLLYSILEKTTILEEQIDSARPEKEDLENLTDEELELQLTLFEAFQITAKLFIRQAVLKTNPSTLTSQILVNDLMKCLDITIGSTVQASLVFPVFIAGIHCVTAHDRQVMRKRIELFIESYGTTNVTRVRFLMERVWETNPNGNQVVDWYKILHDLDWEINFA